MGRLARTAAGAFAVTAGAMIATPLARRGGRSRMVLADVVVGGLAATTLAASARAWGSRPAVSALGAVAAATLAAEQVGSRTGVPFGRYGYTDRLRPQVAGVPVVVPAAWFAMAVPARQTAHVLLGPGRSTPARRAVAGAALLTAWDLFLDPQMTAEGYWTWASRGRYRGIPAVNYAGWFVTGLGVMALLERLLPLDDAEATPAGADRELVGLYAWMAVMSALGFAAFFRDPLVAAVGGAAMVPPAVVAVRKALRG